MLFSLIVILMGCCLDGTRSLGGWVGFSRVEMWDFNTGGTPGEPTLRSYLTSLSPKKGRSLVLNTIHKFQFRY